MDAPSRPRSPRAEVTGTMLRWARELAGWSPEDAATAVGVATHRWAAWEQGSVQPTMSQLRALADAVEQPVGVFFLEAPPNIPDLVLAFRRLPGAGAASVGLSEDARRAVLRRQIALDLADDPSVDDSPILRLRLRVADDVERAGAAVRAALGVSVEDQLRASAGLPLFRQAVERSGVLVFETRAARVEDARGFSLLERPLPVIVLNGKDAPTARTFTLLHECAHLGLGLGAVCDGADRGLERFCDEVAAVALLPRDAVQHESTVARHHNGSPWADAEIRRLASRFGASEQALLLRLVGLGLASPREYEARRAGFRARRARAGGGPVAQHVLTMKYAGRLYPKIVLAALARDAITFTDVARYLDLGPRHVGKLEQALAGRP